MALLRTSDYGKLSAELKRIWKEAVKTQSRYYGKQVWREGGRHWKTPVSTSGATADIRTGRLPNTRQSVANTAPHFVRELWFIIIIMHLKI